MASVLHDSANISRRHNKLMADLSVWARKVKAILYVMLWVRKTVSTVKATVK